MGPSHEHAPHEPPLIPYWIGVVWFVIGWGLGCIGFHELATNEGRPASLPDAAYQSLQLAVMHFPHGVEGIPCTLQIARWMLAIFLFAVVLSTFWHRLRREVRLFLRGRFGGHAIICGLGEKGAALVERLCREGRDIVAIDASPHGGVRDCETHCGPVVLGASDNPMTLETARVSSAREVIAVGGDDHINIETAMQARALNPRVRIQLHLTDPGLRAAFEHIDDNVRVFDIYAHTARKMLLEFLPLADGGLSADDSRQAQLIVIGFGRLGQVLALRAAQLGQFGNRSALRLSVLDRDAAQKRAAFFDRHPAFADPAFREFGEIEFIECDAASEHARRWLDSRCADRQMATCAAIAFGDDVLGFESALRLLPALRTHGVRIALRFSTEDRMRLFLTQPGLPGDFNQWTVSFGMLDFAMTHDALRDLHQATDVLAVAIHEHYRTQRLAEFAAAGTTPASDPVLAEFSALPHTFRDSNRQQADHLRSKVRAVNRDFFPLDDPRPEDSAFTPAERDLLAEIEHRRWCAERMLEGWRFAAVTDKPRRLHSSLAPWHALPNEIQQRDYEIVDALPHIARLAGKKICRIDAPVSAPNNG